jgi:hypothetical protein
MTFLQKILGWAKTAVSMIQPIAAAFPVVGPIVNEAETLLNQYDPAPAYPLPDTPLVVDIEHFFQTGGAAISDYLNPQQGGYAVLGSGNFPPGASTQKHGRLIVLADDSPNAQYFGTQNS